MNFKHWVNALLKPATGDQPPHRGFDRWMIVLLEAGTRSATVRSTTRTQLLALERQHFDDLLAARPEIAREIHEMAEHRRKLDAARIGSKSKGI